MRLRITFLLYRTGVFALVDFIRDVLDRRRRFSNSSYAQHGEDRFILDHFRGQSGTYIDVGASHPFRLSNTYLLYRHGWRGVTVEPIPRLARKHRHWRGQDIQLNVAAGENDERAHFIELVPSVLSTFSSEKANELIRLGAALPYRRYDVPVLSLTQIYRKTLYPKVVDVLTIDSEGFGLSILKGLDFDVLRPRMIVLEIDNHPNDEVMRTYLRANGYETIHVLGCNELFALNGDRESTSGAHQYTADNIARLHPDNTVNS